MAKPGEPALPLASSTSRRPIRASSCAASASAAAPITDSRRCCRSPARRRPSCAASTCRSSLRSSIPMRMWTANYFGALAGTGGTQLLVTPAQHRAADVAIGTSTQRRHTDLDLRLFYSGNLSQAALSDAPSIVGVDAQPDAGGVAFTAQVVGDPAAAIYSVWVTYTTGAGTWAPLDLEQCAAPLPAACGATKTRGSGRAGSPAPPAGLQVPRPGRERRGPRRARRQRRRLLPARRSGSRRRRRWRSSRRRRRHLRRHQNVTAGLTFGGAPLGGKMVTSSWAAARPNSASPAPTVASRSCAALDRARQLSARRLVRRRHDACAVLRLGAVRHRQGADEPLTFTQLPLVMGGGATGFTSTLTAALGAKQQPLLQLTVTYTLTGPGGRRRSPRSPTTSGAQRCLPSGSPPARTL